MSSFGLSKRLPNWDNALQKSFIQLSGVQIPLTVTPWEFLELIVPLGWPEGTHPAVLLIAVLLQTVYSCATWQADTSHWAAASETTDSPPETSPSSAEHARGFLSIYISANAPRLILCTGLLAGCLENLMKRGNLNTMVCQHWPQEMPPRAQKVLDSKQG